MNLSLLNLTCTCGAAPVQFEGELSDGKSVLYLYFRARHDEWQCGIGRTMDDAVAATVWIKAPEGARCVNGEYEGAPFAASYMPTADALRFIAQAIEAFAAPAETQQ